MRSSGIKNGEYVAGCRPCICTNRLIYKHLRRTSGRKLDYTIPFSLPTRRKCLRNKQLRRTTGRKRPPFSPQLKHLAVVPAAKKRLVVGIRKKETCRESRQVSYTPYGLQLNVHEMSTHD